MACLVRVGHDIIQIDKNTLEAVEVVLNLTFGRSGVGEVLS